MVEFIYILFLLSGFIKSFLLAFSIPTFIDFTLLTAITAFIAILIKKRIEIEQNNIAIKLIPVLFFIWIVVSLFYSFSPQYSIVKTFLFSTNLIAIAIPFFTKKFDTQKALKYLVFVICFLSVGYYLFNADIQLKITQTQIVNYIQLEGFGLGLGELIGCAFFVLIFSKIKNKVLLLSFFTWMIFSTGARGPILFLFVGLILLGLVYAYEAFTKKTSFVYDGFTDIRKEILQVKYLLVFSNLILFFLLVASPRVNQMYQRTFWRLGLLTDYENKKAATEEDFDEYLIKEKTDSVLNKNTSNKLIKSTNGEGFLSELKDILGTHNKSIGINKSMIDAEFLEQSLIPIDTNRSVSTRVRHIKFSKKAITANAKRFVIGYGIGSYGIIKTGVDGRNFPHNIFLETWVELGLIGVLILCTILFFCFNKLNNLNAGLYFALMFLLLNLMKSSSLVDMRIFWGLWAITILLDMNKKYSEKTILV